MFSFQLHSLLLEGNSFEAQVNRELFTSPFGTVAMEIPLYDNTGKVIGGYKLSPIFEGILHKRAIALAEISIEGRKTFRQPFYRSSGTATPELSPKGTWWPFAGLWTEAYLDITREQNKQELPIGWIGKFLWSARECNWILHNKRIERLGVYRELISQLPN